MQSSSNIPHSWSWPTLFPERSFEKETCFWNIQ